MATAVTRFDGMWIGETQGYDSPAHLWEIKQTGSHLQISTRWEGEPANIANSQRLIGTVAADQAAFTCGRFSAILVDPQHFIIAGWDTNDTRGHQGEAYDVIFSRPGIAELTAHSVWQRYTSSKT